MKKLLFLLSLVLALALGSCSPFSLVNSETYNDADLASYKTFHIVSPADGQLPPGMQMVTYYNIAAAIREQMIMRGYTEDPTSPLLVNIGLTVHKEIDTEPALPPGYFPYSGPYYNGYYPYFMYPRAAYWDSYYANARVITGIYKEGVLTMDMVNIREKLPLFSASVATILENGNAQFRDLSGIAEAVKTLFSRFPVPLEPQYRPQK
ncbi:MAG: DUF4136 domain-containing protein [Bacteroides sp.]|nr:DUF4136 domain-containing protein [Bacteroides sp.]MCM1094891.1 DUF4136 domain-containing protein [Terasakiella sp.]